MPREFRLTLQEEDTSSGALIVERYGDGEGCWTKPNAYQVIHIIVTTTRAIRGGGPIEVSGMAIGVGLAETVLGRIPVLTPVMSDSRRVLAGSRDVSVAAAATVPVPVNNSRHGGLCLSLFGFPPPRRKGAKGYFCGRTKVQEGVVAGNNGRPVYLL